MSRTLPPRRQQQQQQPSSLTRNSNWSVQESWNRIRKWMHDKEPRMLHLLNTGVSDTQIEELEDYLGICLPEDFRNSYRDQNGATATCFFNDGTSSTSSSFFSINEILSHWDAHNERRDKDKVRPEYNHSKEIQKVPWSQSWIPFGVDSNGHELCLDLDPSHYGTRGQVIRWYKSDSEHRALLVADSFINYFREFANDVATGKYSSSGDGRDIVRSPRTADD